jgi:DNA-binding response OmpR family regulator
MNGKKPKVLVLEDQWLIAAQLEDMLTESGFDVVGPVSSIAEATRLAETETFDAAILDVSLHNGASLPFAETLQVQAVPFLFMTGYGAPDLPPTFRTGVILQKPISKRELVGAVNSLVTGRRAR